MKPTSTKLMSDSDEQHKYVTKSHNNGEEEEEEEFELNYSRLAFLILILVLIVVGVYVLLFTPSFNNFIDKNSNDDFITTKSHNTSELSNISVETNTEESKKIYRGIIGNIVELTNTTISINSLGRVETFKTTNLFKYNLKEGNQVRIELEDNSIYNIEVLN